MPRWARATNVTLPDWFWVVGFVFGAVIGSFLNVVIYRVPRGKSLWNPSKSFCPKCSHDLGPADLFPLLSYAVQGGKCRYCKAVVPIRYFFVELLNASLWAYVFHLHLIQDWNPGKAVAHALACSTLVAIIYIDWELYIIPDQINAFLLFVGLGYNAWLFSEGRTEAVTWGMPSALAGWIVGVVAIWVVALMGLVMFKKDSMGHGDIKMARGIGAVLFPGMALGSFGLAVVAGAVIGAVQVAVRRPQPASASVDEGPGTEPESLASLVKCGIGYLLCFDVIGLFAPKFYERYFGENPYSVEEALEDPDVERTMIPFGPYLAVGAIAAALFEAPVRGAWNAYVEYATKR